MVYTFYAALRIAPVPTDNISWRMKMQKWLAAVVTLLAMVFAYTPAYAQGISVGELKVKGATVLSADEIKALVTGARVQYENDQFNTQMKLDPDGKLYGSSQRRVGASFTGTFLGEWKVTDGGQWCAETRAFRGGETKWCRSILKVGDKYYYTGGAAKDDTRPAFEMAVSK